MIVDGFSYRFLKRQLPRILLHHSTLKSFKFEYDEHRSSATRRTKEVGTQASTIPLRL